MNKSKKKIIISIVVITFLVGLGTYNHTHRFDIKPEEIFVENENLELIIDDSFIDDAVSKLDVDKIKKSFSLLNTEKEDISYGTGKKVKIVTYGDKQGDMFNYVVTNGGKVFPLYAKILSSSPIKNIKIGEKFSNIAKTFNMNTDEIRNFKVAPLDGGLFFEFYFDKSGRLNKIIFRNTYIH